MIALVKYMLQESATTVGPVEQWWKILGRDSEAVSSAGKGYDCSELNVCEAFESARQL
jgi:hypothetical protein